jgi:hypothetical protein
MFQVIFAHHQEFIHLHSALVYAIQVSRQLSSKARMVLLESAECTANKLLMIGRGTARNM